MRSATSFLPATIVSSRLLAYFDAQLELGRHAGVRLLASLPELEVIESLIDMAFWISLRKEEGYSPRISFALMEPHQTKNAIIFSHKIRLTAKNIVKISPAVFQPGVHLGVCLENGALHVWGAARVLPTACFVVQIPEPGMLVVKHPRLDGFGKFVNVAIIKGDQVKLVDEKEAGFGETSPLYKALKSMNFPTLLDETVNILIELSTAMRSHGRGGLVVMVPGDGDSWKESVLLPIHYAVDPPYRVVAELIKKPDKAKETADWQENMKDAIELIGGFTAVDGATIVSHNFELLAYGAKLGKAEKNKHVSKMMASESVVDSEPMQLHPARLGGTRHLAAAQFIYDQRDALALVASQDGRFTIFFWSSRLHMICAHRIDSLLL